MWAHRSPARQGGMALILVLWTGALLMVLGAAFAFSTRTEALAAAQAIDRAQAQALAEGGIRRAILGLLERDPLRRWQPGRRYEAAIGEGRASIAVFSEHGKVDLNAAPLALLRGLMAIATEPSTVGPKVDPGALAAAIVDWRDADDRVLEEGAEDAEYRAAGRAYGTPDQPLLGISELRRILGVTPEIYAVVAPHVTVYSRAPGIDPVYATRTALRSVPGLGTGSVDEFLSARAAAMEAANWQPKAIRALARQYLAAAKRHLSRSRGAIYTVVAEGVTPTGARAWRRAVVRVTGNAKQPYRVFGWYENIPPNAARTDTSAALTTSTPGLRGKGQP